MKSSMQHEFSDTKTSVQNDAIIYEKLDEFITLLSKSDINKEKAKQMQRRFDEVVENMYTDGKLISPFIKLDEKSNSSREELLDDFDLLLAGNPLDSKISKKYLRRGNATKVLFACVGFAMIFLGIAAIIMPAPAYLHVANNGGLTTKDIFASIIMLSGVFLLVKFTK
jgi:hypothetical protein